MNAIKHTNRSHQAVVNNNHKVPYLKSFFGSGAQPADIVQLLDKLDSRKLTASNPRAIRRWEDEIERRIVNFLGYLPGPEEARGPDTVAYSNEQRPAYDRPPPPTPAVQSLEPFPEMLSKLNSHTDVDR